MLNGKARSVDATDRADNCLINIVRKGRRMSK